MKMRLLAIVLVLAMLLAGCGAKEPEAAVSGKIESAQEAESKEERPVSMGRLEGGTYINEYAGYACDLDSNWTFYSAEELQELPDNVREMIADTELGDAMEGVSQFTDMMAENVEEMVTVNALYQKQTMQERVAFAMVSDEEILDETLKLKDTMIEAYTQMGLDVESIEKTTVTFLGEERAALRTVASVQGVAQYILQVFDYRLGQYSVTLTATSFVEDKTEWVLEQFYPVS